MCTARKEWEIQGQKKVVLSAQDVEELKSLKSMADKLKLSNSLIIDAGRTEIKKGTITCIGIGPDKEDKIDKATGHLKLLD
ncbi:MAG: aminoacyl-tRNA hydrolase [Candidatus Aenigmarchaeota archaeon]|nr:aminoacyl-tRNA hydrolase [Candidatus Aenigmarchaeota archaeon]